MNNTTARAYVVSRLNDEQLSRLHAVEVREGYRMTPAWIHERFNTIGWGSVPDDAVQGVERVVMAIYLRCQAQHAAKIGGAVLFECDAIHVQHDADLQIRRQDVNFQHTDSAASMRERVRGKAHAGAGRERFDD